MTLQFLGHIFVAHCRICICEPYNFTVSRPYLCCLLSNLYLQALQLRSF